MNDKAKQAREIFDNGFNCSQAVLASFAPSYDLSPDMALRIAGAFGAGMGRMGQVCGAVTGAFMTIGLVAAKTKPREEAMRDRGYALVRSFTERFNALHGTINCRELIGIDLSTDTGLDEAREKGVFQSHCARFVEDAAGILDEILSKPSGFPVNR